MWKGVTDFLENVDQKAAEFAQKRGDESPHPLLTNSQNVGVVHEDDWDLEGSTTSNGGNSKVNSQPSAPLVPLPLPPQPSSVHETKKLPERDSNDVAILRQQLATVTARLQETQRAADAEIHQRNKAFLLLQADYEAAIAKNGSLAVEIDHWQLSTRRAQESYTAMEIKVQELETELSEMRSQHHNETREIEGWEAQCNEQLSQLEEQRRQLAAAESQARKANNAVSALQSELSDYKLRSKISIDEKDKIIAELEQRSREAASFQVEAHPNSVDSANRLSELEMALKQREQRIRSLTEQLQEKTNEASKVDQDLKTQQLLNAQMKELIDGEQSSRTAVVKALEARISEKQATIANLEKKLALPQSANSVSGGPMEGTQYVADLERKSKDLAQLLMEKQSALEAKRAEVDQWRTRYEVSQQRLREAELVSTAVNRGENGDGASRRNPRYNDLSTAEAQERVADNDTVSRHRLMTQIASKGGFGASVVHVADQVDRFSLRAGGMLRQNSLLRLFLVCYVIILQLYVFVVISVNTSIPHGNAHEGVLSK